MNEKCTHPNLEAENDWAMAIQYDAENTPGCYFARTYKCLKCNKRLIVNQMIEILEKTVKAETAIVEEN